MWKKETKEPTKSKRDWPTPKPTKKTDEPTLAPVTPNVWWFGAKRNAEKMDSGSASGSESDSDSMIGQHRNRQRNPLRNRLKHHRINQWIKRGRKRRKNPPNPNTIGQHLNQQRRRKNQQKNNGQLLNRPNQ